VLAVRKKRKSIILACVDTVMILKGLIGNTVAERITERLQGRNRENTGRRQNMQNTTPSSKRVNLYHALNARLPVRYAHAGCVENVGSRSITRDQDSKKSRKFGLNDMVRNKKKRGDGTVFENVPNAISLLKYADVKCVRTVMRMM
jgi:hypothetical protein